MTSDLELATPKTCKSDFKIFLSIFLSLTFKLTSQRSNDLRFGISDPKNPTIPNFMSIGALLHILAQNQGRIPHCAAVYQNKNVFF